VTSGLQVLQFPKEQKAHYQPVFYSIVPEGQLPKPTQAVAKESK